MHLSCLIQPIPSPALSTLRLARPRTLFLCSHQTTQWFFILTVLHDTANLEFDFIEPRTSADTSHPPTPPVLPVRHTPLAAQLATFNQFGTVTRQLETRVNGPDDQAVSVPVFVNEFWTAQQRQAHKLHEISYRACFKPQLPRFFIERLTDPGDVVYDPFMGRGTTLVEAALLNRVPWGCDINPLSVYLTRPRLRPPTLNQVVKRLAEISFDTHDEFPEELLVFYHPDTLREICALKKYLVDRRASSVLDPVDEWIWMIGLNRLTGHSPGFFSVYTLPPNQAVSVQSQRKINLDRNQTPPRRNVPQLITRKTRILLSDTDPLTRQHLEHLAGQSVLLTRDSRHTPELPESRVALVVTSPPFLNIVDYATDNWLRCWFIGIDAGTVALTVPRKVSDWQQAMTAVFHDLNRLLRPGGHVAFEVGEVNRGTIKLEEIVVPCGLAAGLEPLLILINDQKFTKTANCWGVDNNSKGTNTNRIVVFHKTPGSLR
jgi:hypothetical protein